MIKSIKIFLITFFIKITILCFVNCAFGKVIITGERMEIRDKGKVTVLKGNSKIVSDLNIMTANNIIYNESESFIFAYGNVNFLSNLKDDETVECCGDFAHYDMNGKNGKIWGSTILKLKYFMNNSNSPTILCAQEVYVDDNLKTLKAYNDVEVTNSYGTVYSDNAIFFKKELYTVFEKDKKRPEVYVSHNGKRGICRADKIVFYNSDNKKKNG